MKRERWNSTSYLQLFGPDCFTTISQLFIQGKGGKPAVENTLCNFACKNNANGNCTLSEKNGSV